ncbi:E3 ubiquitin-protein ligase TRIM35-like [Rhinichthys klamathensis goyatoka]|uniref:E3 ubiquitin-protein ligase TRIM35-like n=1 Tax=Rhinichthys klamathensis goyatoka TaxID=3034132 RepID=UPI0024B4C109|nr:E3 ubiquitin-protein ligase TRIM35-like [Rhinichthys klamathensis goyatoka]
MVIKETGRKSMGNLRGRIWVDRKFTDYVRGHEEFNTALTSLLNKLKHGKEMKEECDETIEHIKSQAEHTERQIKEEFEKLHQFLRDEEEATITALREEEEQKKQRMKEKLKEINRHFSSLSHTIRDMEKMKKDNDISFIKVTNQSGFILCALNNLYRETQ